MPPRNPTKHLFCPPPPPILPPPGLLLLLVGVRPRPENAFGRSGGDPGGLQIPSRDPRPAGRRCGERGGGSCVVLGGPCAVGGGVNWTPTSPPPPSPGESDNRNQQKMEMKVWDPDNPLTDRQIDQFLVVARSADAQGGGAAHWMGGEGTLGAHRCHISPPTRAVGTFARALDCSSSIRQPSLHMSAAAASRDITLVRSTKQHTELGVGWGEGGVS